MSEKKKVDTLIVGFNFENGEENAVLVVGRKEANTEPKIIRVLQGKYVNDLYKVLAGGVEPK